MEGGTSIGSLDTWDLDLEDEGTVKRTGPMWVRCLRPDTNFLDRGGRGTGGTDWGLLLSFIVSWGRNPLGIRPNPLY